MRRLGGQLSHAGGLGANDGRRETSNQSRIFLRGGAEAGSPACAVLDALQQARLVGMLSRATGAVLDGCFLRVEYCQDADGFWLDRHTDIAAKRFTLLIYLNDPPPGEDWGTDLYDACGSWAGRAPSRQNAGLAFIPGSDTWHGFEKRRITSVRRSLIANYVGPEWRARHELAFAENPVAVS